MSSFSRIINYRLRKWIEKIFIISLNKIIKNVIYDSNRENNR